VSNLSLSELLVRIANVVASELRAVASSHDLKPVQLQALLYLARCNRYSDTPAALTEYLGLTKGTVSQTLIALEGKGLLEKSPDPTDGRLVRLSLTSASRAIVRKSQPLDVESTKHAKGARSTRAEEDALKKSLVDLLAGAQRARGGRSFGVCSTCRHFETVARGFRCGLTSEALSQAESRKICREHLAS